MLVGLGQIRLSGFAKVVANAVFVVGSFMGLAGADVLGENLFLDLYVVGLVGFLLWFRILLSQWNNERVCGGCRACFL